MTGGSAFPSGNRLSSADGPTTRTASANQNNASVDIQIFSNTSFDNVKFYPQIEVGSTATSYEPYVGGIASPNPDYPQNVNVVTGTQTIKATGKNLWDFTGINPTSSANFTSTFQDGELSVNWTGGFDLYPTNGTSDSVALDNTQTYTLSAKVKGSPLIFKVRGGSEIFRTTTTTEYTQFSGSFTGVSSLRIDIIRLQSASGSASIKELQLEVGSTATDYQPFAGMATYTVDLGATELCKIGTYQDYIYKSGDDWYVHKEIGEVILDGTVGSYNATQNWYYAAFATLNAPTPVSGGRIISNYFTESTASYMNANRQDNGLCGVNDNTHIVARDTSFTTTSAYQTWLSTNTPTFYYALATPTDTKITDNTLISQLNTLLNATLYQPLTYMSSSGNLPAIIKVEAYTEHLNSLLEIASEPTPTPITYSDFVGTDGVNAGSAGLVPAPTASDNDKYLKSDGTWATVSGGGSITPVQTTGTSTTDVMSQNAVSSMIFSDAGTDKRIRIGYNSSANYNDTVAIGYNSSVVGASTTVVGASAISRASGVAIGATAKAGNVTAHNSGVAIGYGATTLAIGAVAIGRNSSASTKGEMNIGTTNTDFGYNSSNYRLLSGVYDGQGANDAVNVGQVNATIDAINTALNINIPHIGAST